MPSEIITRKHGLIRTNEDLSPHDYNEQLTRSWLKRPGTKSHTEGFICAIHEQEIRTRALIAKREQCDNPTCNKKCRYCHNRTEDIFLCYACDKLQDTLGCNVV